jgi:hypothetical protein
MQLEQKVSYIYLTVPVITKIYEVFRQETGEKTWAQVSEQKTEKSTLYNDFHKLESVSYRAFVKGSNKLILNY